MSLQLRPEIKVKWLEALRSGDYTQTDGVLFDGTGYCCLGVLCDVAAKEGAIPPPSFDGDSMDWEFGPIGDTTTGCLPGKVQEWAFGITDEDPASGNPHDPYLGDFQASDWNDSHGASFEQIANLIEKHL